MTCVFTVMLVPDGLLEALIERQILSETGLSLEPFKRHDAFGPEFETELLLVGSLVHVLLQSDL